MSSTELTPEIIREWLTASCSAQGVPVTIRDPGLIAQVATLLGHHHRMERTTGRNTADRPRISAADNPGRYGPTSKPRT